VATPLPLPSAPQTASTNEEELTPAKRKKTLKKEEGKENGEEQSAYLFKMEQDENGVIDLENDRYATTTFSCTVSLN
jgi:hypothetical protein